MSGSRSVLAWTVVLTIGAAGWSSCAWLLWPQKQSQENWAQTHHRLEDQLAFHRVAQRRTQATNTGLALQLTKLEREVGGLTAAHGELASVLERQVLASDQLTEIEARKEAAEVAVATLVLQQEVLRSRSTAMEVQPRQPKPTPAVNIRRQTTVESSAIPTIEAIRKGLYAFTDFKIPGAPNRDADSVSNLKPAAHIKAGDEQMARATRRSVRAAFKRADAPPESLGKTDWAEAQLKLGRALAAKGQRRSGTRELREAVLAFRAVVEEWSRENAPLRWATVQFELGRTLAMLGRRLDDPAIRQASVEALGNALDVLIKAGKPSFAAEAKRLIDEMTSVATPPESVGRFTGARSQQTIPCSTLTDICSGK